MKAFHPGYEKVKVQFTVKVIRVLNLPKEKENGVVYVHWKRGTHKVCFQSHPHPLHRHRHVVSY